jgi:hypothetical protein
MCVFLHNVRDANVEIRRASNPVVATRSANFERNFKGVRNLAGRLLASSLRLPAGRRLSSP